MKTLDEYLDYQQKLHNKEIDLELSRIKKVYTAIFPSGVDFKVVSIAGTNGKGSTGVFLANILQSANINYGWFSSPHINKYNERFKINANLATDAEIVQAFEIIEKYRKNISLSYFEFSTLTAIVLFAIKKVKVAIMEVGLGGRLDSTNILDNDIAIITSIGLDHQEFLGDSLDKIAYEKAGIMREGKPVVLPQNIYPEVMQLAKQQKAKIYLENKLDLNLKLQGKWQQYNASLASREALLLDGNIGLDVINQALENTTLAGRGQIINYKDKEFLLDSAHNSAAVINLEKLVKNNSVAIFAVMQDKDYKEIIKIISPKITHWYLLPLSDKRALEMQKLHNIIPNSTICDNANNAVANALLATTKNIVVFGSFLTISAISQIIDYN
jgi:dihydrofolate synthase/folylpolyglutamate synthase